MRYLITDNYGRLYKYDGDDHPVYDLIEIRGLQHVIMYGRSLDNLGDIVRESCRYKFVQRLPRQGLLKHFDDDFKLGESEISDVQRYRSACVLNSGVGEYGPKMSYKRYDESRALADFADKTENYRSVGFCVNGVDERSSVIFMSRLTDLLSSVIGQYQTEDVLNIIDKLINLVTQSSDDTRILFKKSKISFWDMSDPFSGKLKELRDEKDLRWKLLLIAMMPYYRLFSEKHLIQRYNRGLIKIHFLSSESEIIMKCLRNLKILASLRNGVPTTGSFEQICEISVDNIKDVFIHDLRGMLSECRNGLFDDLLDVAYVYDIKSKLCYGSEVLIKAGSVSGYIQLDLGSLFFTKHNDAIVDGVIENLTLTKLPWCIKLSE